MATASDVYQFRQAAPGLATSGQPREEELLLIAKSGHEVVMNLALHDDPRYSLADEAGSGRVSAPLSFGSRWHAPVGWNVSRLLKFALYCAALFERQLSMS